MRSVRSIFATILLTLALAASAPAQSMVTLGESIAPLVGPWKFHIGDNPQWANPSFDDSTWGTINLIPRLQNIAAYRGASYRATIYFAPGWTMQGYPGYSGYAWYRLRVTVNREHEDVRDAGKPLAIAIPPEFDDAYQVYVDGRLAGEFGRFTPRGVTWYLSQMHAFTLDRAISPGTTLTIAIRVWMSPATLLSQRQAGGLHVPPLLGHVRSVDLMTHSYWQDVGQREASAYLEIGVQLLAILVVFGLYWLDHGELAYLWLGLSCASSLTYILLALVQTHTLWLSGDSRAWFLFSIVPPVQAGLWLLFWAYWFRLGRRGYMAWLYGFAGAALTLLAVAMVMQQSSPFGGIAPLPGAAWLFPVTHALAVVPGVLLVVIAFLGIRKTGFEGWLALPALCLQAFLLFGGIWNRSLSIFGIDLPFARLVTFTALAIITLLMLRRFLRGQSQREQWKLEMEQARQVQQLLVPATPPATPGFSVESVYLPAQQVGGDFFQISPCDDGSLLVVVGDVSGKGLKAAMTVSAIVGGLKQIATREPSQVLAAINNQVLDELSGGFVTCCALRLSPQGTLTIANAGHLAPYLNGKELATDGALPLGLASDAEFPTTCCDLQPGDVLTLLSDGIVEAQDVHGHLFGFDRVQEMLRYPVAAAALAKAAQSHGQEDDITVLRIEFEGAAREAALA